MMVLRRCRNILAIVSIIINWCCCVQCLVIPFELPNTFDMVTTSASSAASIVASSSSIDGTFLLSLLSASEDKSEELSSLPFSTKSFRRDYVVRVLDANTIKLKDHGIVSLAGVRMPTPGSSNFQFPECLSYNPAYKLRQFIPSNTVVLVKLADSNTKKSSSLPPQAILIRNDDLLLINKEVVRSGFGKVQKLSSNSNLMEYLDYTMLQTLQEEAKANGLGIFQRCDDSTTTTSEKYFEAQFEPLEFTVETQWGIDGGKQVIKQRQEISTDPPKNPGDVKGCSDFNTYEDALRWYEYYKPYYGDVAKLDRDGDGVPCPGLPHTSISEKYRMKIPDVQK